MHVVFYLGPSFEKWDPKSIEEHGSGASEWMATEIARHLARRGHEVVVYADTLARGTFDGVVYVPQAEFGAGPITDVLVAYRRPEVLDLSCLGHTDRLIFVTTDKHHEGAISDAQVAMTQRFVVVSEWHKRRFQLVHKNVPDRKLVVIPNGVRRTWAGASPAERKIHLIHTSAPDRGLEYAIRAMPAIREHVPAAVLHVYADFSVPLAHARQQQDAGRIDHLQKLELEVKRAPGVVFHGRVGRRELISALADSRVWVYPASAEETSCVAAMEAQVLGCRVVASRLGALEDTCSGHACALVAPPWEGTDEYTDAVVRALGDDSPVPMITWDRFSLEKALEAYEEVITGQAPRASVVPEVAERFEVDPAVLPVIAARERASKLEALMRVGETDPHLVFSLAEAYRDSALISRAHETFKWRMRMENGSKRERYEAALEAAKLTERLTSSAGELARAHVRADRLRPEAPLDDDKEGEGYGGDAVPLKVLPIGDWKLVLPSSESARSLEDFRQPLAEALLEVAGRDGVPASGEIWFGVHEEGMPEPTPGAIIFQSEVSSSPWFTTKYRARLARAAEVWDYSTANQPHYQARLKRHVPLRWSRCEEHGGTVAAPPIDLGLIGSVCPRRAALQPELKIFNNVAGGDRVKLERSIKVHVVPHFYEGAPVEQARISGLLASGHCVVAEQAPDQADYPGVVYAPIGELIQTARAFLENDLWKVQGREGQRLFRRLTMVDALKHAYRPEAVVVGAQTAAHTFPLCLNLGACDEQSRVAGYVSVDIADGADVKTDLTKVWPWQTSSVDEILAVDLIEHLSDKIFTMNEAFRVLKPGGILKITVPTTDGRGAFQDPTHVSYWNRNSFWYFTAGDPHRERFGARYGIEARFRVQHERRREGGEGTAFLEITLEAVKPARAPVALPTPDVRPASIGAARGASEIWAGSVPPKFVAMLRVKNEARWLERVLKALRDVTDEIHVLDDHSTDDTRVVAQCMGAHVYPSPYEGLDETRDKNLLFDMIKALHKEDLREDTRLWVIGVDGDEELEPGAAELLRKHTDPGEVAYSFQVLYLWNREDQVRVDGVYGNFRRMSMFRPVRPTLRFEGTPMGGNLHCKSIPEELIASGKEHPVRLLHYGYLERNDRVAKYLRYNKLDPHNLSEDQYRHIVQGDGLVREATGGLQAIVPPEERLKWAGPIAFVPLVLRGKQ